MLGDLLTPNLNNFLSQNLLLVHKPIAFSKLIALLKLLILPAALTPMSNPTVFLISFRSVIFAPFLLKPVDVLTNDALASFANKQAVFISDFVR